MAEIDQQPTDQQPTDQQPTDQQPTDQQPTDQHPTDQHPTSHGGNPYGVDPNREPSAEWGWHGNFPVAGPIAGWFTAFALFAMLLGNHESHVEDAWLIGLGLLLVVMLIGSHLSSRKARRR